MRTGPYKLLTDFAQKYPNTSKDEDNIPIVTEDDYEHLVVLLGELTDVVREDENHIFAPLMEFAILLIEKYDHAQMPELAARIENCRAQQGPNAKKEFVAG